MKSYLSKQLLMLKKSLYVSLCIFYAVMTSATLSQAKDINIKPNSSVNINSSGKKKQKKPMKFKKLSPNEIRTRLVLMGAVFLSGYLGYKKEDIMSGKDEELEPGSSTAAENNVMKLPLSGNSKPSGRSNVKPLSQEELSQSIIKPQNMGELSSNLVVVETKPENIVSLDQVQRFDFAGDSLEAAQAFINEGYPRDQFSDQEEVDFILKTARRAKYFLIGLSPKSNEDGLYFDFKHCQQNNNIFGFFVRDPAQRGGKRIILCQNFFDQALSQPTPELKREFAKRMYISMILLEAGMANDRIVQLLFSPD